nr:cell division protein [Microspora sp. UTEX LB472]
MQTFKHQKFLYWKEIASKWKHFPYKNKLSKISCFSVSEKKSKKKENQSQVLQRLNLFQKSSKAIFFNPIDIQMKNFFPSNMGNRSNWLLPFIGFIWGQNALTSWEENSVWLNSQKGVYIYEKETRINKLAKLTTRIKDSSFDFNFFNSDLNEFPKKLAQSYNLVSLQTNSIEFAKPTRTQQKTLCTASVTNILLSEQLPYHREIFSKITKKNLNIENPIKSYQNASFLLENLIKKISFEKSYQLIPPFSRGFKTTKSEQSSLFLKRAIKIFKNSQPLGHFSTFYDNNDSLTIMAPNKVLTNVTKYLHKTRHAKTNKFQNVSKTKTQKNSKKQNELKKLTKLKQKMNELFFLRKQIKDLFSFCEVNSFRKETKLNTFSQKNNLFKPVLDKFLVSQHNSNEKQILQFQTPFLISGYPFPPLSFERNNPYLLDNFQNVVFKSSQLPKNFNSIELKKQVLQFFPAVPKQSIKTICNISPVNSLIKKMLINEKWISKYFLRFSKTNQRFSWKKTKVLITDNKFKTTSGQLFSLKQIFDLFLVNDANSLTNVKFRNPFWKKNKLKTNRMRCLMSQNQKHPIPFNKSTNGLKISSTLVEPFWEFNVFQKKSKWKKHRVEYRKIQYELAKQNKSSSSFQLASLTNINEKLAKNIQKEFDFFLEYIHRKNQVYYQPIFVQKYEHVNRESVNKFLLASTSTTKNCNLFLNEKLNKKNVALFMNPFQNSFLYPSLYDSNSPICSAVSKNINNPRLSMSPKIRENLLFSNVLNKNIIFAFNEVDASKLYFKNNDGSSKVLSKIIKLAFLNPSSLFKQTGLKKGSKVLTNFNKLKEMYNEKIQWLIFKLTHITKEKNMYYLARFFFDLKIKKKSNSIIFSNELAKLTKSEEKIIGPKSIKIARNIFSDSAFFNQKDKMQLQYAKPKTITKIHKTYFLKIYEEKKIEKLLRAYLSNKSVSGNTPRSQKKLKNQLKQNQKESTILFTKKRKFLVKNILNQLSPLVNYHQNTTSKLILNELASLTDCKNKKKISDINLQLNHTNFSQFFKHTELAKLTNIITFYRSKMFPQSLLKKIGFIFFNESKIEKWGNGSSHNLKFVSQNELSSQTRQVKDQNFLSETFLPEKKEMFRRLNTKKIEQKKRRRKKQKRQTRRKTKRKRVYPRPSWLRFPMYQRFLKTRHPFFEMKKLNTLKEIKMEENEFDSFLVINETNQNKKPVDQYATLLVNEANSNMDRQKLLEVKQNQKFYALATTRFQSLLDLKKIVQLNIQEKMLKTRIYRSNKQNWGYSQLDQINFEKLALKKESYLRTLPLFEKKYFFQIPHHIINNLKRLSLKSYWLRSHLKLYLKRVQTSLDLMKKSSQKKDFDLLLPSFLVNFANSNHFVTRFGHNSSLQNFQPDLVSLFSFANSNHLKDYGTFSALKKELPNYYLKIRNSVINLEKEKNDFSVNSIFLNQTLKTFEYKKMLEKRIQNEIQNMKENVTIEGIGKARCFKMERSKKNYSEKKEKNKLSFPTFWNYLEEGIHYPKALKNSILFFVPSEAGKVAEKNREKAMNRRLYWALNKTNIFGFRETNSLKNIISIYKTREQKKSNPTKKMIWNQLSKLQNQNYMSTKLQNKSYIYSKFHKKLQTFEERAQALGIYTLSLKLPKKLDYTFRNLKQVNQFHIKRKIDRPANTQNEKKCFRKKKHLRTHSKHTLNFWWSKKSINLNEVLTKLFTQIQTAGNMNLFSLQSNANPNQITHSISFANSNCSTSMKNGSQVISLPIFSFWFCCIFLHVSSLISLLHISEVRSLMKFQVLILYKLSNSYLTLIFLLSDWIHKIFKNFVHVFEKGFRDQKSRFSKIEKGFTIIRESNLKNLGKLTNSVSFRNTPGVLEKNRDSVNNELISTFEPFLTSVRFKSEEGFQNANSVNFTQKLKLNIWLTSQKYIDTYKSFFSKQKLNVIQITSLESTLTYSNHLFWINEVYPLIKQWSYRSPYKNIVPKTKFGSFLLLSKANKHQTLIKQYSNIFQINDQKWPTRTETILKSFLSLIRFSISKGIELALLCKQNQLKIHFQLRKLTKLTEILTFYFNFLFKEIPKQILPFDIDQTQPTNIRLSQKSIKTVFLLQFFVKFVDLIEGIMLATGHLWGQSIFKFLEKPTKLIIAWIAEVFFLEWSSDLLFYIPDTLDLAIWTSFQKVSRGIKGTSFLIGNPFLTSLYQKRLLSLMETFVENIIKPDTDLLMRQKQGILFWDIWADILIRAAEEYGINIPSLTTLKEEQDLLLEKLGENGELMNNVNSRQVQKAFPINQNHSSDEVLQKQTVLTPTFQTNPNITNPKTNPFSQEINPLIDLIITTRPKGLLLTRKINLSRLALLTKLLKHIPIKLLHSEIKSKEETKIGKKISLNSLFFFSDKSLNKHSLEFRNGQHIKHVSNNNRPVLNFHKSWFIKKSLQGKRRIAIISQGNKWQRWSINQSFSYESRETDLFLDIHPPKSFRHFHIFKRSVSNAELQPVAQMVCKIYSGSLLKQISKNLLVIGSPGSGKSLLIQAIAGETELKMILDHSQRYATVSRGIAVGMKLLREVFDALALHAPCLFLMEEIHLIGERRPLLISDDENAKAAESGGANLGFEREEVHERNQVIYQLSKHSISHYKKPYKGDFSLLIPTNHFCFDLFLGVTKEKKPRFGPISPFPISYLENEIESNTDKGKSSLDKIGDSKPISNHFQGSLPISQLQLKDKNALFAPPATSPFTVFILKEQKKLKPRKIVQQLPWGGIGSSSQNRDGLSDTAQKANYSVRAKVSLLADMAISNLSAKLDRITDLLVIIDSVRSQRGFIVFATTHIPFVLDPALRRPGRLDETISIPSLPNLINRLEILKTRFLSSRFSPKLESNSNQAWFPKIRDYAENSKNESSIRFAFDFMNYSTLLENLNETEIDQLIHCQKLLLFTLPNQKLLSKLAFSNELLFDRGLASLTNLEKQTQPFKVVSLSPHDSISIGNSQKQKRNKSIIKKTKALANLENQLFIFQKYIQSWTGNLPQKNMYQSFELCSISKLNLSSERKPFHFKIKKEAKSNIRSLAYFQMGKFVINSFVSEAASIFNQKNTYNKLNQTIKISNAMHLWPEGIANTGASFSDSMKPLLEKNSAIRFKHLYSSNSNLKNQVIQLLAGRIGEFFAYNGGRAYTKQFSLQNTSSTSKSYYKSDLKLDLVSNLSIQTETSYGLGWWSLDGIDDLWRSAHSLILSIFQKRYLYQKNSLAFQLLDIQNRQSLKDGGSMSYGSGQGSGIFSPAKRFENFKRTEKDFQQKSSLKIYEKIQLHQQQKRMKELYQKTSNSLSLRQNNLLISETDSKINSENQSSSDKRAMGIDHTSLSKLEQNKDAGIVNSSSIQTYYRNRLLFRHRFYLTNLWWNGHLAEHNAEATFSSDIDWRYLFVKNLGDIMIDFPDAQQHYNPRNRRWILNSGYWGDWYTFEKLSQQEIYSHFALQCFNEAYKIIDQNREILDYLSYQFLNRGPSKPIDLVTILLWGRTKI